MRTRAALTLLAAVAMAFAVAPTVSGMGFTATRAAPVASESQSTAWESAISDAEFTKTQLDAPNYQYLLLGNGGLNLLAGPTGFTDVQPPNAGYEPGIFYDYWWDNKTKRVSPFDVTLGQLSDNGDVLVGTIDDFDQSLDVGTGVLDTQLELTGCADTTCGNRSSNRTHFVTPSGVLVTQVTETEASRLAVRVGSQESYAASFAIREDGLAVTATRSESDPLGLSVVVDGQDVEVDAEDGLISAQVSPDHPMTVYVAAAGVESGSPAQAAYRKATQAAERGLGANEQSNRAFWRDLWQRSSIDVPDPMVMKWYVRSQYYLAATMANHDIPPGCYGPRNPNFNGGQCIEWDQIFTVLALLAANQTDISAKTADWIEETLPAARELADHYTFDGQPSDGAKYPWISSWNGVETSIAGPTPVANDWLAFPSANVAMVDILQAQYTGDRQRLSRAKEILREVTEYQLDNTAREPDLDNQIVSQKFFWQWSPAALSFQKGALPDQTALLWSLRQARDLGVGPREWREYADEVYMPTAFDPVRQARVLNGFIGSTPSITNTPFPMMVPLYFLTVLDPRDPLAYPSYMNATSANDIDYTFNRGWSSTMAAMQGNGEDALRKLYRLIEDNDTANPSTAVLWDDTVLSECVACGPTNTPEVGAHGAFMLGAQAMLFDGSSSDTLRVFPALPTSWESDGAAFDTLLARGGLEVSGRYADEGTEVSIRNVSSTPQSRNVLVRIPADAQTAHIVPPSHSPRHLSIRRIVDDRFASVPVTLRPGESVSFAVRGERTGEWVTVDDVDPQVTYDGEWQTGTDRDGFHDGTVHFTTSPGASASLTFSGTAVRVLSDRNSDHGQVRVVLDGELVGDYDTWMPHQDTGQVIFARDGLPPGQHTITLISSGIKNAYSAATVVSVDAIQVLRTAADTAVHDADAARLRGPWQLAPTDDRYRSQRQANQAGATATFAFQGTEVRVIGTRGPAHGILKVAIDGVPAGTVDSYAFTPQTGQQLFRSNGLDNGEHTITVTATGSGSANSTGATVGLQAFEVVQPSDAPQPQTWPYVFGFVAPNPATVSSGQSHTFDLTLWGRADEPITGEVRPSLPSGWSAQPVPFTIDTQGEQASTTVSVTVQVPASAASTEYRLDFDAVAGGLHTRVSASVTVANVVYSFDDGTSQGWQAGPGVSQLEAVTRMANGPTTPAGGSHLLQFNTGDISSTDNSRFIFVEPDSPLDLSHATTLYAQVNSWGLPPFTQPHQVEITVHSGSDSISATSEFFGNRWNKASIDLSSWPGRASITRIQLTYTFDVQPGDVVAPYADLDEVGFDSVNALKERT